MMLMLGILLGAQLMLTLFQLWEIWKVDLAKLKAENPIHIVR